MTRECGQGLQVTMMRIVGIGAEAQAQKIF